MQALRCARCASRLSTASNALSLAPPRGMPDLLPATARAHRRLQDAFWGLAAGAGYAELAAPLLEHTALFARSLGDGSDVVSKEMYSFQSPQGGGAASSRAGSASSSASGPGTSLTLRPEGTAGVLRAVLAAELHRAPVPARVAYCGPMFRHERPQRGRQRQFTQVGLELVGSASAGSGGPLEDVEVIALAHDYLRAVLPLGAPMPALHINTLGSDTRAHSAALAAHFGAVEAQLSSDSRARLQRGAALRILDSKDPLDAPHIAAAPPPLLPQQDAARFEAVLAGLAGLGIAAQRAPRLVRGLDYYAHTIFEFVAGGEGGSSTVLAGGRYDRLPAQMLGGAKGAGSAVSAIGWAAGVERLHLLCSSGGVEGGGAAPPLLVAILPVSGEPGEGAAGAGAGAVGAAAEAAMALWRECRGGAGLEGAAFVPLPPHPSLQKQLARAHAAGAGVVVIVRAQELAQGQVLVKHMGTGAQHAVAGAQGVLGAVRQAIG